jgi:glutaminase
MGATLANQGINPVTGVRAIEDAHVEHVLSVMASCGMYDFSGGWIYDVGMPAKSGVGGGVLAVLPGQLGIGVFSPRLDERGNSVRALRVCEDLSRIWQLHQFNPPSSPRSSLRVSATAAERSSTRIRHAAECAFLRDAGGRIRVVEVQGNLAFSTTESIVREIMARPDGTRAVIVDFHHATAVNEAAARLLGALAAEVASAGSAIFFTHVRHLADLPGRVATAGIGPAEAERLFRFPSTDQALEWCEDELLCELMPARPTWIGDLRGFEIVAGLDDGEIEVVGRLLVRRAYAEGEPIVREGDEATGLFLVTRGRVGVWLGEPGRGARVASFSTGTMVGELAFIDGERRSAHVVAEGAVECAQFDGDDFRRLAESHPRIHAAILRNIAASLATKLRRANRQISVLTAQLP